MKKNFILFFLLIGVLAFKNLNAQVNVTNVIPITSTSIGKYEKYEIGVSLNQTNFANVFNPNEIDVYAIFTSPNLGLTYRINAFWYQDFNRNESTPDPTQNGGCDPSAINVQDPSYLTVKPTNLPWRIRFTPDAVGIWNYRVYIKFNGQTTASSNYTFNVTNSNKNGYICVGYPKTHFVFKNTDKLQPFVPFVPIGVNVFDHGSLIYNRAYIKYTKKIMQRLAEVNGNTIRIFMSPEQFGIEWNEDGLGKYFTRQNRAFDLDEVFNLANQLNIKIDLVIVSNHEFHDQSDGAQAGYNYWQNNPYRPLLGWAGITPQYSFFYTDGAKAFFMQKLRYIIARWGYSTSLLSYELLNEADIIVNANPTFWDKQQEVKDWHEKMINYAKTLDNNHMYTTSVGHMEAGAVTGNDNVHFFSLPSLDYVQDHYYSNDMNLPFNFSAFAQYSLKEYHKPYITGEFGSIGASLGVRNFTSNNFTSGNNAHDMIEFHNAIWASLFNGSAGPAYTFDARNLFNDCWGGAYKSIKPMSQFLNGDDFFAQTYSYTTNKSTGSKGIKDDPSHNYGNNSMPIWTSPFFSNPPLLETYISRDINTTNDDMLDVFATRGVDRIYGWVHHRKNYWYELPHTSGGDWSTIYNFNDNQPSTAANIPTLTRQSFTLNYLYCDGMYKVDFYSTYPQYDINGDNILDDGGIIPSLSQSWLQTYCGSLTIPIPQLSALSPSGGSTYLPDYAFKITKIQDYWTHSIAAGGLSQLSKLTSYYSNNLFYSDYNGAIRQVSLNTSSHIVTQAMVSPALPNQAERATGPVCVNEGSQVFYRGYDGRLQCYYLSGNVWNHIWLTDWSNTTQNVGSYITTSPFNIFYQGSDLELHRYFYNNGTWQHSILPNTNGINGKVYGAIAVDQTTNAIYYKGGDGRLQCYYLSNGVYQHIWLTDWSTNSQNVGGDIKWTGVDVYFVGSDGYLHNYHFSGSWVHSFLRDGNNNLISIPTSSELTLVDNGNQIFFTGADGQIRHLYNKQGNNYFLDNVICYGNLQSDYVGNGTICSDNQQSVYYVGQDNNLHLYAFNNGCYPHLDIFSKPSPKPALSDEYIPSPITKNKILADQNSIATYPNPFSDVLKIETYSADIEEIRITNVLGQIVYTATKNDFNLSKLSLNTSKFASGIYIVTLIKNGETIYTKKIIKK